MKTTKAGVRIDKRGWRSDDGRSVIETLIVVTVAALLTTAAMPQLITSRRLIRSSTMQREIATQLRFARQQAMSQRQAFTFQYNDSTKTIRIFDHQNNNNANSACNMPGVQVLTTSGYPNTSCTVTALTVSLATALPASEIKYGVPTTITNSNLADGTSLTALAGNVVNITFQPNGTVIDSSNNFINKSLYFYNNKAKTETAVAISVLGAAGRVKVWRYSTSASQYAE